MSAYNILKTKIKCSNCFNEYKSLIQFKFGDTWQLEYCLGDKIKWGGNDIGRPGITEVKVYGVLDNKICPICNKENSLEEYDIFIIKDIIDHVKPIEDIAEYFTEEVNFKICKE